MAEKKPFSIRSYGPARKVRDMSVPQSLKRTTGQDARELKLAGGLDIEKLAKAVNRINNKKKSPAVLKKR